MKRIFYFAYGSNLLSSRLRFRIGNFIPRGRYILENYELVFNCFGYANIISSPGNSVEGYLYEVNSDQISELNKYEALYNAEYFDIDDNTIAVVYIAKENAVKDSLFYRSRANTEYLQIILEGCREKGLQATYNKVLNHLNNIIANLPRKPTRRKASRKR